MSVSNAKLSGVKAEIIQRQRDWLHRVVHITGYKPSRLATLAGVSDSTVTRLLNDPDYAYALNQVTIDKIKQAVGLPGPEEIMPHSGGAGWLPMFTEAERLDVAPETLVASPPEQPLLTVWELQTNRLARVGYLPGDLLLVDITLAPTPYDIVHATIMTERGTDDDIFRVYDPPFLVAAPLDVATVTPLLIDHQRVILAGVVVELIRRRRGSAPPPGRALNPSGRSRKP